MICLYIWEDGYDEFRPLGGARKWWLDKSLRSLATDLDSIGGKLILRRCDRKKTLTVIEEIVDAFNVNVIVWNRRYAPQEIDRDREIKAHFCDRDLSVSTFNGSLLAEPWTVKTQKGDPYRVFTPFWNSLKAEYARSHPDGVPELPFQTDVDSEDLDDWKFHPKNPDWSSGLEDTWVPGEDGARKRLSDFLETELKGYSENRDRPDISGTSKISPYLSFGEISPQSVWEITRSRMDEDTSLEKDGWSFLREIGWRDFCHSLLYQATELHRQNWNSKFDRFEWETDEFAQTKWSKGLTGYPIVDAGMRQLWTTGWMHNRVRMIVASFLTKHLRQHWTVGEEWFWDTLVDADLASNPANWQWVAGSGADAAPYFRIFNPITQGEKFDPNGDYVRQWVPELKKVPTKYLFSPWTAPKSTLTQAGVTLGQTYPKPIVSHDVARKAALAAYEEIS